MNKIIEIPISELKNYENNAKLHSEAQIENLKKSLTKFGWMCPCIVDKNNVLVVGHGRVEAARRLGIEKAECIMRDDLSEDMIDEYRVIDNLLSEGGYDEAKLKYEINRLDIDYDFSEINTEIEGVNVPEAEEEIEIIEDEVPEVQEKATTKIGDIWQLGEHRLICGDSTNKETIGKLIGGGYADICFTSPPYNVGESARLTGNTKMTDCKYENGNDDLSDYDELLNKSTNNMIEFSRWAFVNLQMLANNKMAICDWVNENKDSLCDIAIWYKTTTAPAMAERVMNSQFEFVFIFSKENNNRAIGTNAFRGTVSNVYEGSPQRNNEYSDVHSATYPISFCSHFISNFTNQGDSVLDVFGGTGTTLIACEQLGRKCYMCELDERYCDVIVKRWEEFTGQKAVLINE